MRRLALLTLSVALSCTVPASAASPARCPSFMPLDFRCSKLQVPLDHAGQAAGKISLSLARRRADRPSGKALVYLSGGPGGAGLEELSFSLDPVLALGSSYDLVGFDQRGTGASSLIVCSALQKDRRLRSTRLSEACAERIGPRRRFFTTAQTVRDLEAVRRAVGARKLLLFGVSYGTKVALAYARAYPERVERMILDSVVDPDETDPWGLGNFAAIGPSLRSLCPASCRGISSDPLSDLQALNEQLSRQPLKGLSYDENGRRHRRTLTGLAIADLLFDADYAPGLRALVPGAVRAALSASDPAPLLRLMEVARPLSDPSPVRSFSVGRYATVCEETPLPWDRSVSDPAERLRQATERAAALPAGSFSPFDFAAIRADEIDLCLRWPVAPEAPVLPAASAPFPDVRVLLLQGLEDIRTPPSVSRHVAAKFPRARRVVVPGLGHAVLGSDPSGCAERRLYQWLGGRSFGSRCRRVSTGVPATGVPPSTFEQLRPPGGLRGTVGRTVAAVDETLQDLATSFAVGIFFGEHGSGLRGGTYSLQGPYLVLRRLRVVPGVFVSGHSEGDDLHLTVSGPKAADGQVVVSAGGRLRGRLGGRRVSVRLSGGGSPQAVAFGAHAGPRDSPVAVSARTRLVR